MKGQYSIWDHPEAENLRPCDYRFRRYIGQRVVSTAGHRGIITEIFPYYTYFRGDDRKTYVGTPTTIRPEEVKAE